MTFMLHFNSFYYARKKLYIHNDNLLQFCRILALKWAQEYYKMLIISKVFWNYRKHCNLNFFGITFQLLTKWLHFGLILKIILIAFNLLRVQILSLTELKLRFFKQSSKNRWFHNPDKSCFQCSSIYFNISLIYLPLSLSISCVSLCQSGFTLISFYPCPSS